MKKSLLLFSAITFGATLVFSQTVVNNGKQAEKTGELLELKSRTFHQVKSATPEAPIWSEDFSGGIPSSWTNAGYDDQGNTLDSALWEYRGTATFPDNTVGSRGLWNFGRGPIQSPTLNNGFVIFDSDYLDNAGISGNQGNGIAPSPHLGTLTSGTINLSGHPNVELKFNSYHRYFEGRALVAFSIDGGITWGDTLACHSTLAVNWQTDDDAVVELNVSDIIGNESNVKIRFIFDGTYDDPGANGSGSGYYFWMIDDVEMNDLPKHNLRFTGWGGAPAQDAIFGPADFSSKMGYLALNKSTDQMRDVTFDANAYNYGYGSLNDVKLKVNILDQSNTLITSYTSTSSVNLNSNDTANYNSLNTYATPYKHNASLPYQVYYEIISDSASVSSDTITFNVSETEMGIDFNFFSNSLGTPQLGDDGCALASRIDLVDDVLLEAVWIRISSLSQPGALIEVEVYDTAGFDFLNGFPSNGLVGTSISSYTLTQADIDAGFIQVPVTDGTENYIHLTGSSYFLAARMYSNSGANIVRIANDQTFPQPRFASIMYNATDARWYSHYTNSYTLDGIRIRGIVSVSQIGVQENILASSLTVAPNPASDFINVKADGIFNDIHLELIDITGKVVMKATMVAHEYEHTMDISELAKGIYVLRAASSGENTSFKIVVD